MKLWDMSDMYALINNYPNQFERGFRLAESVQLPKDIKEIVISAVSYNSAVAEIIQNVFKDELTIPLIIHKESGLPHKVSSQTLLIAISLCGHRAEVVSAAKAAYETGAKIIIITTGGELEDFARERKLPLILAPKELPEWKFHMGQGIILAILVQLLINAKVLTPLARQCVLGAASAIEKLYLTKLGQKLADLMVGNNTLIYSSSLYSGLSRLIKTLANTLLLAPCFSNSFTELKYSEIYGLGHKGLGKYLVLILQDKNENPDIQKNITDLQTKLTNNKTKHYLLDLPGQNQLEKNLAAVMLFYWVIYAFLVEPK